MASKARKHRGSIGIAPTAVKETPEKEVIPGKITESQWLELLHSEESTVVAGEVIEGLLDLAFTLYQDHYLEEQAFPHTIQAAKASLLQIIEWQFLQRDEGEKEPENDPTWLEDDEPVCSVIDSWARGIVPQVSGATEEDTTTHPPLGTSSAEDEESLQSRGEISTPNSLPPRSTSRRPTQTSTVGSSSSYTAPSVTRTTAEKVPRSRPQARRPGARLVALTQTHCDNTDITADSHQQTQEDMQVPSPAYSHTPVLSPLPLLPSSHPPSLPYNMKPAQLRWQKDVTYDSSGKIVDMVRLDPSRFPSHRVRPRVHVSDPTPSHGSKHAPKLPYHHPSPPSLVHTSPSSKPRRERERGGVVKEGMKTKKGMGFSKRREEEVTRDRAMERDQGTREDTHRFPDVLTLPPLVDTIDVSPGVRVREGDRSVQGPPSPRRPPHFLLPHTTMIPVHSHSVTTKRNSALLTTGDSG